MNGGLRTAVAVAATPALRRVIPRALAIAGIELLAMRADAASAMRTLHAHKPDLLICEAQLPMMEGARLVYRALCTPALLVRPRAALLHDARDPMPLRRALEDAGVAMLERAQRAEQLAGALRSPGLRSPRFCTADIRRADALLDALGVPAHRGRDCLRTAALCCAYDARCMHNLSGMLYPRVGELCGMDAGRVERAMRHAIGLAWQSDKFDNQYQIFADTVDAGRGQPTCGEMISRLADILRLEG